jgi:hypothetical protein
MPRYIDADKFKNNLEKAMEKRHLICGVKAVDVGAVIAALQMLPTADVVPRSEVDEIFAELEFEIAQLDFDREETRAIAIEGIIAALKKKYTERSEGE